MRVITGVALIAGFGIILSLFKARGAVALVSVVLAFAVFEFFTALRQRGFQPAILPGALATLVLPVIAFNKGAEGLLIALMLATLTTLLWFLFGVVRDRPAVNIAVTIMGVLMIGLLGGVSGLILRAPNGLGIFYTRGGSCPADFDGNGVREVSDIFAFLAAWFAGSASA